jgi:hypothetical protein
MTYDFKKGPEDFSWVTDEVFEGELREVLSRLAPDDFLDIPGIYEIVAEHFNNEVLTNLQRHREEAEDNDKEEQNDAMAAGDECPNCRCGTIEETDDEFRCRGECGSIFRKEKR